MPEFIGFRDAGFTTDRGHNVAHLILLFSFNEARPIEIEARCHAVYRDAVIKSLTRRLYFPRPEIDVTQHRPKIDQAEYLEAMKSINDVIPAEAEIQVRLKI
jgi:hypothetical protein